MSEVVRGRNWTLGRDVIRAAITSRTILVALADEIRTMFASAFSRLVQTRRSSVSKGTTQSRVEREHAQQLVLGGGEVDGGPAYRHPAPLVVDGELAEPRAATSLMRRSGDAAPGGLVRRGQRAGRSQVAGAGAVFGGCVGRAVRNHPRALPVADEHDGSGRGAAAGELVRQAYPSGPRPAAPTAIPPTPDRHRDAAGPLPAAKMPAARHTDRLHIRPSPSNNPTIGRSNHGITTMR